jgi:hypothetical protein
MYVSVNLRGIKLDFLAIWSSGRVMLCFGDLKRTSSVEESVRRGWLDQVNAIPGIQFPEDAISKWPTIPLVQLADETRLYGFLATLDWLLERLKTV